MSSSVSGISTSGGDGNGGATSDSSSSSATTTTASNSSSSSPSSTSTSPSSGILNTFTTYAELRNPPSSTSSENNVTTSTSRREEGTIVDVVRFEEPVTLPLPPDSTNNSNNGDDSTTVVDEIPFLHIVMLMSFSAQRQQQQRQQLEDTSNSNNNTRRIPLKNGVFQSMAASLLAIEHLNTRNTTLVKEISNYMIEPNCPLRFTFEALDDALSEKVSVSHAIDLISRRGGSGSGGTTTTDPAAATATAATADNNTTSTNNSQQQQQQQPSAILGSSRSANTIPTSIITGLNGYPQISPIATSTQLEDTNQYPLFGRTVPSDIGTAIPAILYLRYRLGVKHLGVIHVNDQYGNGYALGLQLAAAEYAPDLQIQRYDFPFDVSPQLIEQTISLLRQTQFRYFFGVIFSTVHYEPIMTEAFRQGIAGTGQHNWIFSDSVSTSTFSGTFEKNSAMHLVSKGVSRIGAVGGVPGIPFYDNFLRSVQDLNNTHDIDLIQSQHPVYPNEPEYEPLQIRNDPDFFSVNSADAVVPFLYDATIAVGLAACHAYSSTSTSSSNNGSNITGEMVFESFKSLSFQGASGQNRFSETGTREPETARFTLLNIVEEGNMETSSLNLDNPPTNTVRFKVVETDVFEGGEWLNTEFPYIFNDGTTIIPPDLPPVEIDNNYLGTALRGMGYFFSALVLVLSVGSMIWTYKYRQKRVVKASQPIFLYLISAGVAFMGLAILFLSFDDQIVSENVCTAFCIAVPWLTAFGWILAFSAIFTKTHRVNLLFHNPARFKRIKVTVLDVMKPFIIMLLVAGITLLVWTILHPPVWERSVTDIDIFRRDVETKGFCDYDDSLPYGIILVIVLVGVVARSAYEGYVARNVSTEFAESDYIFLVLCITILITFLGIPVLFIARDQPQARFFVAVSILFIICIAILGLIFVPKMVAKRQQDKKTHFRASSVYVTGLNHPGGNISETGQRYSESMRMSHASMDDDEGIRVNFHPNDVDNLKNRISSLMKENKALVDTRRQLEGKLAGSKETTGSGSSEDCQHLLSSDSNIHSSPALPVSPEEEDELTEADAENKPSNSDDPGMAV